MQTVCFVGVKGLPQLGDKFITFYLGAVASIVYLSAINLLF